MKDRLENLDKRVLFCAYIEKIANAQIKRRLLIFGRDFLSGICRRMTKQLSISDKYDILKLIPGQGVSFMMICKETSDRLQRLINSLGAILDIEIAVFDRKCHLIGYTPAYLRQKGKTVHNPSVEEVMQEGKMIVNEPGRMASCKGCRFKDNCPATIEILNCIQTNRYTFGVVALTSFTESGHARIANNPAVYLNISRNIAEVISTIFRQENNSNHAEPLDDLLQSAIGFSDEPIMVIDHNGLTTHTNEAAQELFSFCNLSVSSLKQILPPAILNRILLGEGFADRTLNTPYFGGKLTVSPVQKEGQFAGAVLTLEQSVLHRNSDVVLDKHKNPGEAALERIVGNSPEITVLKKDIVHFADAPSSVLVTGDTGTGKELVAQAIHANSSRREKPFVAVNCASIPETLFESELFGYMEGAFTGAKKGGKAGRFQMANEGTLFLDEIGEMPLSIQAKLLRVLQSYTVEPLGSTRSIPVDVRVIAATNQDLEQLIMEKKFRADLFYRINVIPLHLPELKKRREDIPELCHRFVQYYSQLIRKPAEKFAAETIERMKMCPYDWPGNIRELENAVEYAVNRAEEPVLTEAHLPPRLQEIMNMHGKKQKIVQGKIAQHEKDVILELLERHGWQQEGKGRAAEDLGISVRTLYRKLKKHNITGV